MFFITVKGSTVKFCATLLLGVLLVTGLVFVLPDGESLEAGGVTGAVRYDGIKDPGDMVAFLQQFGWQVAEQPIEDETVSLPQKTDAAFAAYNDLQRSQGLDLEPYSGKRVRKTVFLVTNYGDQSRQVLATLFVYKNRVVAGDLASGDPSGFVCGFEGEGS